jgi:hypothetical protein
MAVERDLELLDDYLANRMDAKSRAAFEQKINADQELKGELEIQQQMISGIKNARVAELKQMLNNVPVPAGQTAGTAAGTKITLWVAVAGIIATGVYFYVKEDTQELVGPNTETVTPEQNESPVTDTHSDGISRQKEPTKIHQSCLRRNRLLNVSQLLLQSLVKKL